MLLVLLVPSVCVTCAFGLYWTNDVSYALMPCDCIAVLCSCISVDSVQFLHLISFVSLAD